MDDETRQMLQRVVGDELGLPSSVHGRIAGDSIAQMRSDARALASDLGLAEARPRAADGRFAGSMNQRIRAAAGRS